MEIKYFGQGQIYVKGKKESVWVNPGKNQFNAMVGEARIVIFTDRERNFVELGQENNKVIICGPGEYEVGGVEIGGVNAMYTLTIDGIKMVLVSRFEGEINEKKKEKLEEADVLFIGIWEGSVDVAKKSAANYIIPIEYEGQDKELKVFLDAFDIENLENIDSLKVEKESLPEAMEVVLLKTK